MLDELLAGGGTRAPRRGDPSLRVCERPSASDARTNNRTGVKSFAFVSPSPKLPKFSGRVCCAWFQDAALRDCACSGPGGFRERCSSFLCLLRTINRIDYAFITHPCSIQHCTRSSIDPIVSCHTPTLFIQQSSPSHLWHLTHHLPHKQAASSIVSSHSFLDLATLRRLCAG